MTRLTDTELTTLATMLSSGTEHMSTARKPDGTYAWDNDEFLPAVTEIQAAFYGLQVQLNIANGEWNRDLVKLSA
jgi:hypothetical protein